MATGYGESRGRRNPIKTISREATMILVTEKNKLTKYLESMKTKSEK